MVGIWIATIVEATDIENGWGYTKLAKTTYFHCGPSIKNFK